MKLFVGGRQSGKSTKLVEWMLESDDRYILSAFGRRHYASIIREVLERKYTHLTQESKAVKADAALSRVRAVEVKRETVRGFDAQARQEWMVDDLDALLRMLVLSGTVVGATHSPDIVVQGVQPTP